jgi:hypothetical protein
MGMFKKLLHEAQEAEQFREGFLWSMYLSNVAERKLFNQEPYKNYQEYINKNYHWLVRVYELEKKRRFK